MLNDQQHRAVTLPIEGHALVLAGAGSGKTSVLIARMVHLMECGIAPYRLMAVTFTNKAAREMQARMTEANTNTNLNADTTGAWIGTFHSIAHRMLRRHGEQVGLSANFQILDSDDQFRLIKRCQIELNLDPKQYAPRRAQSYINRQKDNAHRAKDAPANSPEQEVYRSIYYKYEAHIQQNSLVDFGELLLSALHLLGVEEVRDYYQGRFRHILVDEFQDTNRIQYLWVKALSGEGSTTGNVFVVGDDDQSIYGFRGARIENIQNFSEDFGSDAKPVTRIDLEQNYRSTGNILACANSVIATNKSRLGKVLWTASDAGEPVYQYRAQGAEEEVYYVWRNIAERVEAGGRYEDSAILYRNNVQSRLFEEHFNREGIPYRIYGGMRFFERLEVKNILAYLRLIAHPDDNAAFLRVVNTPPRGIGDKTIAMISAEAATKNTSLFAAARQGNHKKLLEFCAFIDALRAEHGQAPPLEAVKAIATGIDWHAFYAKESKDRADIRTENINELAFASNNYASIQAMLDSTTLNSDDDDNSRDGGNGNNDGAGNIADDTGVQMMTMHAAKGLEFQQVFLVGWEQGIFPHQKSLSDAERLEEERRLAYVGITRARTQLHISYAGFRQWYGQFNYHEPSCFLTELPEAATLRI